MVGEGLLVATGLSLRAHARAAGRKAAVLAVAGVLLLTALGFLIAAAYLFLLQSLSPAASAGLVGVLLLAAAGLIYGISLVRRSRRVPPPDPTAALAQDVLGLIRSNPLEAVLLALSAGMTAGSRR